MGKLYHELMNYGYNDKLYHLLENMFHNIIVLPQYHKTMIIKL